MNLREALREAIECGCEVTRIRRTGEMRVRAPNCHPFRVNSRRKDSPKVLETLLRQLKLGPVSGPKEVREES